MFSKFSVTVGILVMVSAFAMPSTALGATSLTDTQLAEIWGGACPCGANTKTAENCAMEKQNGGACLFVVFNCGCKPTWTQCGVYTHNILGEEAGNFTTDGEGDCVTHTETLYNSTYCVWECVGWCTQTSTSTPLCGQFPKIKSCVAE